MRENTIAASSLCADGDWVAVQVRIHRERLVGDVLREHGYDQLVPVVKTSQRAGKKREQVLLPGYVFCRYKLRPTYRIVQAPGVMRLVGVAGRPVAISGDEVEAIRRIAESGVTAEPWRFIKSGDRVQVCSGPLAGLEGLVLYLKNAVRVVVSVTMLRRAVAVELALDEVRAIASTALPSSRSSPSPAMQM